MVGIGSHATASNPFNIFCEAHPDDKVTYISLREKKLVCQSCALNSLCGSSDYTKLDPDSLKQFISTVHSTLSELLQTLQNLTDSFHNLLAAADPESISTITTTSHSQGVQAGLFLQQAAQAETLRGALAQVQAISSADRNSDQ